MNTFTFFAPIQQEPFNGFMSAVGNVSIAPSEPIKINFASGGGDVDVAFRMYEYLRGLNRKIIIENYGDVSSSAIIPFLAGDIRLATSYSVFRIHRLACELNGPSSLTSLYERVASLEFDIDRYNKVFCLRTAGATSPIDILPTLRGAPEIVMGVDAAIASGILTK